MDSSIETDMCGTYIRESRVSVQAHMLERLPNSLSVFGSAILSFFGIFSPSISLFISLGTAKDTNHTYHQAWFRFHNLIPNHAEKQTVPEEEKGTTEGGIDTKMNAELFMPSPRTTKLCSEDITRRNRIAMQVVREQQNQPEARKCDPYVRENKIWSKS
ncbi:hypothetical protein BO71DRAFT_429481 [Aspergillus ellipticus CBS 707.79]|uniref:Uncharacterized protein n=1 Tax=Aspergillus ellipticus CBS 707.79 TaxID=1448320 RepID=A0A319DC16_9EURO|nr:hypothetical protein BO71DRAFT_429481 [Aspergillus ellipticus CBS 707.79]